jgi:hypothetical protein
MRPDIYVRIAPDYESLARRPKRGNASKPARPVGHDLGDDGAYKRRRAGGRQPSPEMERATASHAWSVMRVLLSAAAPAAQVFLTENSDPIRTTAR